MSGGKNMHESDQSDAANDPRPEPPDYDSVPFTGNYSDLGAEEELRRDYERDLEAWKRRNPDATLRPEQRDAQAIAIWRLADQCRLEAAQLRNRAEQLDAEGRRLDNFAAAVADGRSLEEAI